METFTCSIDEATQNFLKVTQIVEKEGKRAKETFMDYHHGEFRYIYGVANGTKKRKDIIDFLHERYSAFEKWRCEQGYEA